MEVPLPEQQILHLILHLDLILMVILGVMLIRIQLLELVVQMEWSVYK